MKIVQERIYFWICIRIDIIIHSLKEKRILREMLKNGSESKLINLNFKDNVHCVNLIESFGT